MSSVVSPAVVVVRAETLHERPRGGRLVRHQARVRRAVQRHAVHRDHVHPPHRRHVVRPAEPRLVAIQHRRIHPRRARVSHVVVPVDRPVPHRRRAGREGGGGGLRRVVPSPPPPDVVRRRRLRVPGPPEDAVEPPPRVVPLRRLRPRPAVREIPEEEHVPRRLGQDSQAERPRHVHIAERFHDGQEPRPAGCPVVRRVVRQLRVRDDGHVDRPGAFVGPSPPRGVQMASVCASVCSSDTCASDTLQRGPRARPPSDGEREALPPQHEEEPRGEEPRGERRLRRIEASDEMPPRGESEGGGREPTEGHPRRGGRFTRRARGAHRRKWEAGVRGGDGGTNHPILDLILSTSCVEETMTQQLVSPI